MTNSFPLAPKEVSIAASFVREMALSLARSGAEVAILTRDRTGEKLSDPELAVHWFPWSGRNKPFLINLNIARVTGIWHAFSLILNGRRAVLDTCREFKPDICLAAWALPSGYFAQIAKRRLKIPYAVWCLGSDIHTWAKRPFFRRLIRRVLCEADYRYADGFELCRQVTDLCDLPCSFLATTRTFDNGAVKIPEMEPDVTHFLYVGRWEKVKGLDVLIEGWRILMEDPNAPKAILHLAGNGDGLQKVVENALAQKSIGKSMRIAGWLTVEQLAGYYHACDCVIIPSRKESIPVVLSEAIHAETPLIVTDVGDMGCLVELYQLGKVVPAESPVALKEAIEAFIAQPFAFDRGKLDEAKQLFDSDAAARRFLAEERIAR